MGASLPDLGRRLSLALECGTGITLSVDDMELMREAGAIRTLAEYGFPAIEPVCSCCASLIYFMRAGVSGPVKIGIAKSPESRRTGHQTSNHEELIILATMPGTSVTEQTVHRFYASEHVRGEWFEASPRLMDFIRSLA